MQRRRIYMTASYWIDVCALRCACKENPACSFIASIGGRGHFMLRHEGLSLRAFQEKLLSTYACRPYRKPTQVISSSRARRTSECAPRNSAKNRPYLRNKACPEQSGPQRKFPWRLFTKNTAPCELVRGCIGVTLDQCQKVNYGRCIASNSDMVSCISPGECRR